MTRLEILACAADCARLRILKAQTEDERMAAIRRFRAVEREERKEECRESQKHWDTYCG